MLSYALAIAVALSSLVIFSTAFLMSKIHRKDDFLWSAVGLFYALVLWFCARNITGAVLLGQAAATILLVSYSWQTIKLRRAIASPAQAAQTNNFSIVQSINGLLKRQKNKFQRPVQPVVKPPTPKVTEENIVIPETPAAISEDTTTNVADNIVTDVATESAKTEIIDPQSLTEATESAIPEKQVDSTNQELKPIPITTETLPLPNKLPETARIAEANTPEKKQVSKDDDEDNQPQLENTQVDTKTEDLSPQIPNQAQVSTPVADLTKEEIAKTPKPQSNLDSLETVEVAEVLEAEASSQSTKRTDRYNIIEVTTTEVTKPDQHPDSTQDV